MQLNVEVYHANRVRFMGTPEDMGIVEEGLQVAARNATETAAVLRDPDRYTPKEVAVAQEAWRAGAVDVGDRFSAHEVPMSTAKMAYRGVRSAYCDVRDGRAEGDADALQERAVRLSHILGRLEPLRTWWAEGDPQTAPEAILQDQV